MLKERDIKASIEFVRELMRELGLLSVRYGARKLYEKEEEILDALHERVSLMAS